MFINRIELDGQPVAIFVINFELLKNFVTRYKYEKVLSTRFLGAIVRF